jgi:hypothetical protein
MHARVYFKKNLELHIYGCYESNGCLTGGGGERIFYLHISDRIMVWLGGRIWVRELGGRGVHVFRKTI